MSETVRLVDIREVALDVAEVTEAVADPEAGGVAVFVGVVRRHDHDRGVTGLEYTAHPTATRMLEEVAAGVAKRYEVLGLAAVHRVGWLHVGDTAVVCAVSTRHRGEAFDACRALIDDLKATVPIWKHQHFSDGSEEWVGTP